MRRGGFTLIELLVTLLLAAIVGLGVTRLLISQTQFFAGATGRRDARAVVRNAVNIVRDEMRMIEPRGIVSASTTSLVVRVPYAMGLYCAGQTATFAPVDSLIWASAVYDGFAYRDTTINATYTYVPKTTAPSNGLAATCSSAPVNITPLAGTTTFTAGRTLSIPGLPSGRVPGSPVLLYQTVTYELAASTLVPGRTALWRRVVGGVSEEIAVPFEETAIFRFFVSGATTPQDAPPSDLRLLSGIEVVLVGQSERSASNRQGTPETAPMRLSIFFRNAVI